VHATPPDTGGIPSSEGQHLEWKASWRDGHLKTVCAFANASGGTLEIGRDDDGKVVELRAGSNDLVCLAARPGDAQWSVACYHESLEPFMARGRELLAQGIEGQERIAIREREIAEGKLPMPREPRTMYVLHGSGFDAPTGEVSDAYLRWVIYTPYATPESTGLTTRPVPGAPWLMAPGTAGAHIMINPPRPDANAR